LAIVSKIIIIRKADFEEIGNYFIFKSPMMAIRHNLNLFVWFFYPVWLGGSPLISRLVTVANGDNTIFYLFFGNK